MAIEYRYLDVLWIDNLIMNFILLWTTFRIVKSQSPVWRLWLSALFGAIYAVALFIPGFEILSRFTMKIALSLCMLLIAFRFYSLKEYLKILGIFYGVTFAFGGAALGLYYFTEDTIGMAGGVFYIRNYPVKILFISSLVIIMLFRTVWIMMRNRQMQANLVYRVAIEFDKESTILSALLDTGNSLCDPISHAPVIVAEFREIKEILPIEIRKIFVSEQENNLEYITAIMAHSSWMGRFRMIPFTSLGKPNGMLIGFRPDKVLVSMNGNWQEIRNTIIGVYNQRLSKDDQYQALMHPEIIG